MSQFAHPQCSAPAVQTSTVNKDWCEGCSPDNCSGCGGSLRNEPSFVVEDGEPQHCTDYLNDRT